MKSTIKIIAVALAAGQLLRVNADQLVLEQFNQPVADNSPIGLATGWGVYAYDIAGGVVTDYGSATPNGNYPTMSRANNGGFGGVTGNTVLGAFGFATPALLWTNTAAILHDCAVSNVVFYTKNNSSTSTEQVAVQVAGQWYVATNLLHDNGGNSVWASNYFSFTAATTGWRLLDTNTLTPGTLLGGPLPAGDFEAVGLFGSMPVTGKIRMDQFSIHGTPPAKPLVDPPTASPSASVTAPTTVTLDATVSSVPAATLYQWRKEGNDLANGPTGTGSTISGALGPQLILANTGVADSGSFDLVVSNSYGATTSAVLVVTVTAAGVPPSVDTIVTVPANGISEAGSSAMSITVTAAGTGPFTYQWWQAGQALTGETSDTLTLASAFTNAGAYTVVISSAYGSVTSAPPTVLTVVDTTPPAITFPAGNPTNIVIDSVFTPFYTVTDNSGETAMVSITGSVNTGVCGSYPLTVTAWDAYQNTNTAVLTVNVWLLNENFNEATNDNAAVSNAPGWHASAVAVLSGQVTDYTGIGGNANFPTLSDNVTAPGAVDGSPGFLVMGEAVNANPSLVWKDTTTILADQQITNLTFYTRNNSAATAVYVAIRIYTNWYASATVFSDTTGGAVPWAPQGFPFPTDPAAWQTLDAETLTIVGPVAGPLPNYGISAVGFYGTMVSGKIRLDALRASGTPAAFPATPPSAGQPSVSPVSQLDGTAWSGEALTFQVSATGTPPLTYQWRKDGAAIAATSDIWTMANPAAGDSGDYDVVVSNAGGSVTSVVVTVTVSPARLLINQSFNQSTNDPGIIGQAPGWHALAVNLTNGLVTDFSFIPDPPASLNFPNLSQSGGAGGTPGYVVMGQGDTVNPVLVWMDTPQSLQGGRITNVLFYTRNSFFSSTLQVAVQLAAQWYVSTTPIQDIGGGINWTPQSFVFTPDAGLWQTLDLATLVPGALTSEALPEAPVTGIGLYGEMFGVTTARLRVDEFQVDGHAVILPQPTIAPVYLNGSGELVVRTATETGWQYVLESAGNLQSPITWTGIATNAGTGGVITNLVSPSSDREFFRYRLQ